MVKIAIGQFSVSNNIFDNSRKICEQIAYASRVNAHIILFCECALTGYKSPNNPIQFSKEIILIEINKIRNFVKKLGNIFVVLGSVYPKRNKYFCSQIIINNKGNIENVYNKRFLFEFEKQYYQPGDKSITLNINDIKFGFLICYENNFIELYREYKKRNVNCILLSSYSTFENVSEEEIQETESIPIQQNAIYNRFDICAANHSSNAHSMFITKNGIINQLYENEEIVQFFEVHKEYSKRNIDIERDHFLK